MPYRILYGVVGGLFLLLGGFFWLISVMAESRISPQTYPIFSMAIMSFCLSYLHPQFKQKDERMKLIRQKGMFYSFIAFIFYAIVIQTLILFDIVHLTGMEVIQIITALMISTIFISWVVLVKVY